MVNRRFEKSYPLLMLFLLALAFVILLVTIYPYYRPKHQPVLKPPTLRPTIVPHLQTYQDPVHQINFTYPSGFKFVQNFQQPDYYYLETPQNNKIAFDFITDNSKTIADFLKKRDQTTATAWEGQPSMKIISTKKTKINDFSVIEREEHQLAADFKVISTYFKIGQHFVTVTYQPTPGNKFDTELPVYRQLLLSIQ